MTTSPYHRAEPGPDGLCQVEGCGRTRIAHLTTRADAFRRLNDALERNGYASNAETTALSREIIRQDNAQSWPGRPDLSDLQRALIARSVNTEINLLKRLYGVSTGTYMLGMSVTFEEQVRALEDVKDWLYPSAEVDFGLVDARADAGIEVPSGG